VKRFARWSTLDNWNRAGDLAAKLVTIIAALAAISFFSARPHLTLSDDIRCRAPIDYILVERAYESRGHAAPKILADRDHAMRTYSSELEFQPISQFNPRTPNDTLRYMCTDRRLPIENYANKISWLKQKEAIALKVYPETRQDIHEFPGIALDLMISIPDPHEFRFALEQVERARYIELLVEVYNDGWGPARSMRFSPPKGFRLVYKSMYGSYPRQALDDDVMVVSPYNPITDLGARQSAAYFMMGAAGHTGTQSLDGSSLFPKADTGPAINLPIVVAITILLFALLWLPLIIKDIVSS
jgi:hypothetical protein